MKREAETKENATDDFDDLKLKLVMQNDSEFEKIYREEYHDFKEAEEEVRTKVDDLHDRFDQVIEDINQKGVRRLGEDIKGEDPYSTEYSDREMYSYKMLRWFKTSKELREIYQNKMAKAGSKEEKEQAESEYT